jgi:hypothetical protein
VQVQPCRLVLREQIRHGIGGHPGRRRHSGQHSAVRAAELELAVRLPIDLVTILVNGAVMAATEDGKIRERRGPPLAQCRM